MRLFLVEKYKLSLSIKQSFRIGMLLDGLEKRQNVLLKLVPAKQLNFGHTFLSSRIMASVLSVLINLPEKNNHTEFIPKNTYFNPFFSIFLVKLVSG